MKRCPSDKFAQLLQSFFTGYLTQQKNVSPQTVAAYRDAFRLLLGYLYKHDRKSPARLCMADLKATTLLRFLDHLERVRHNSIRTRNARWAAIRSFLQYALTQADPEAHAELRKALAIPLKRCSKRMVGFLTPTEVKAVLAAPSADTWSGRRDRVLLQLLYNTGARVSEIIELRVEHLREDHSLQLLGKGRKQRIIPLWPSTYRMVHKWIRHSGLMSGQTIFSNRWGQPLTRDGVAKRLAEAVRSASDHCPTLRDKRVSPHLVRHTTAMILLQAGVVPEVIALWLGHESPETTHLYVEADLALKEQALQKVQAPSTKTVRYRPKDGLLAFLDQL